jgi:hypothetical protein
MSSKYFWDVYMLGVYEWSTSTDNDPNTEGNWLAGWSAHEDLDDEESPTNFIFDETIRDLRIEQEFVDMLPLVTLRDRASAHEALHRFFGWHGNQGADDGIMDAKKAMTQNNIKLTDEQIRLVQKKDHPT